MSPSESSGGGFYSPAIAAYTVAETSAIALAASVSEPLKSLTRTASE